MYKSENAKNDDKSIKKYKKSERLILDQWFSFKINIVKNMFFKKNTKTQKVTNENFDPRSVILIQIGHGDRRRLDWNFHEKKVTKKM